MKDNLVGADLSPKYTYDRPTPSAALKVVRTYEDAQAILESPDFHSDYVVNSKALFPNAGGYISSLNDNVQNVLDRKMIVENFAHPIATRQHARYLGEVTERLIRVKEYSLVGGGRWSIDIVKDVLNLVPVHFVSRYVVSWCHSHCCRGIF